MVSPLRQVIGKTSTQLSARQFTELRAGRPLLLDIGTGDGKHVVHTARARPEWFVVGVDAAPAQLAKVSASAARKPAKGGTPNAMFVQAAVEDLPDALGLADEMHVLMPWGSLLRGMIGRNEVVLRSLRAHAAPGAPLLVTINLHAWRPRVPEVGDSAEPAPESAVFALTGPYLSAGWRLERSWYPGDRELSELPTSWSRRLSSSREQFDALAVAAVAV